MRRKIKSEINIDYFKQPTLPLSTPAVKACQTTFKIKSNQSESRAFMHIKYIRSTIQTYIPWPTLKSTPFFHHLHLLFLLLMNSLFLLNRIILWIHKRRCSLTLRRCCLRLRFAAVTLISLFQWILSVVRPQICFLRDENEIHHSSSKVEDTRYLKGGIAAALEGGEEEEVVTL